MRFGVFTSMGMQTWPAVLDLWRHLEEWNKPANVAADTFEVDEPRSGLSIRALT